MLNDSNNYKGLKVRTAANEIGDVEIDSEIGTVDDCLFDDLSWAVRYLTLETGGWLSGRRVLISPYSVSWIDWETRTVQLSLTKAQVEASPDIDTAAPVTRAQELEVLGYYNYPEYWSGPALWGQSLHPTDLEQPDGETYEAMEHRHEVESLHSHLRGAAIVKGYYIHAIDGELGHVKGFLIDDKQWAIRYLVVATRNWLPGTTVLVSPGWINNVSWEDSAVHVALTREAIKSAPPYTAETPLTRDYENSLYNHYGRPPYWIPKTNAASGAATNYYRP